MTDKKDLKKEKCSVVGCKSKGETMKDRKVYCVIHFNKIKYRQTTERYWE